MLCLAFQIVSQLAVCMIELYCELYHPLKINRHHTLQVVAYYKLTCNNTIVDDFIWLIFKAL